MIFSKEIIWLIWSPDPVLPLRAYGPFQQGEKRGLSAPFASQVPDTENGIPPMFVELYYPSNRVRLLLQPCKTIITFLLGNALDRMFKKHRETIISSEYERGCNKRKTNQDSVHTNNQRVSPS